MPSSNFFALLDDIASLLDDVAVMTKIATKKTAGVLGDDLALNAKQVTEVDADRELPVVWAVAKGSVVNKAILVPAALLISALAPWAIKPLLMVGGAFLCFEGVEKLVDRLLHGKQAEERHRAELVRAVADANVDMVEWERDKIRGAIRTDFILSAEIIVIALGSVATNALAVQVGVLISVAVIMTLGVYGLVGAIVKIDDFGLWCLRDATSSAIARVKRGLGQFLLWVAPKLMKFLSFAGTAAMFLVGGHILVEGVPMLHHASEVLASKPIGAVWSTTLDLLIGVAVGALVLAGVVGATKLRAA